MVATRTESIEAFNHVIDKVIGNRPESGLKSSLQRDGIIDIHDLMTLNDDIINTLQYEDPDNPKILRDVNRGDKQRIKGFIAYWYYLQSELPDISFMDVTSTMFNNFRLTKNYMDLMGSVITNPQPDLITSSSTPATSKEAMYSPVAMFRRAIKKDPSLFPTLKDDRYHDVWHRSFKTQAVAQDVAEVLDDKYVPSTADDIAVFHEKQKFLYAVLESKVLTDRGKAIIRDHEHDYDAQKAYIKIKDYHLQSTKAKMESSVLLSYITSARLGDGTWNGTTESFIINWQNQVRLYEKHVPPDDYFSDGQKRIMLQNAVNSIDELRQVKITADHMSSTIGKPMAYEEYITLLLSAASAHDEQFKPKKVKRHVMLHELQDNHDEDIDYHEDTFDIDCPVSTIQAFATKFNPRNNSRSTNTRSTTSRVRMSSDKWFGLDEASRSIWDKLDEKAKSIILGYTTPEPSHRPSPAKSNFGSSNTRPSFNRQANLHEISAYDFLLANMHDVTCDDSTNEQFDAADDPPPPDESADTLLINAAKSSGKHIPPGDIRRVMSKSSVRQANVAHLEYHVSFHKATTSNPLSLIDRGANGGVAGEDVRLISRTSRTVDIKGIDNHHVNDIGIGTVGGVVQTQHGPVVAIMHQYALLGKGSSIHSPSQLEWFKNDVNDKSVHVPGGLQRIVTLEGYVIPLIIKEGLARLDIRPHTDHEFDTLPHVHLTSELEWDPSVMDHTFHDASEWGADPTIPPGTLLDSRFDELGQYRRRVTVNHLSNDRHDEPSIEDHLDCCIFTAHVTDENTPPVVSSPATTSATSILKKDPDFVLLRPLFGWLSPDTIKKTFQHTTQYARLPTGTTLKRAFKSPNPALNVTRRNESVACDIVYADVPAIDDGSIAAVIFVGIDSQVTDIHGIKSDKQFVNTLEDCITQRGAPHKLISDSAQVIVSDKVKDILRTLCIDSWQSEPYNQQQNAAERRYQTIKRAANRILDRSGAPPYTWLLCLQYVCYLLNHTYNENIHGVPIQRLNGDTPDISVLLRFHFWQKVYYRNVDVAFPSDSVENVGHIVGISEHCGHALTYRVLNTATLKVIHRSSIRPASTSDPNLRAELLGGEIDDDINTVIKSRYDTIPAHSKPHSTSDQPIAPPIVNADELIGHSFIMNNGDDDQQVRARIVKLIDDHTSQLENSKDRIKVLLSLDEDTREEVITYTQLMEYLGKDKDNNIVWKFKRIASHQGPLSTNHADYNGSTYNLMIEWENGETTSEPLQVIAKDDPVTCAIYAKENGLLDMPGWKQFKPIARRQKKFTQIVNQAKLKSSYSAPKFNNGFEIPRTYEQAVRLDERNGNTKFQDATALELQQMKDYQTFIDIGHHTKAKPPEGYKKIKVHLVFDVKHDGRHKARLVADGHLTDIPLESVYSGVVSIRGFRIVMFLAELNKLELWATDIGNAYLEAYTSEKVYIIAGPEFGELEGHILKISKALYGLRSSGARWHDRFADCITELGFFQCKSEPDIWMRRVGDIYEYVAVYVDDLALAMKSPKAFVDILENKHKFKTKGTGPINFHLGMEFSRDDDNTLRLSSAKYIEKLNKNYERMFGELPRQNYTSPLEKGDHPEVDTSEFLDAKGIQQYQSMIGALQWMVTIGRFDILTAVMTMSSSRAAPRQGHLERLKRIYGYLSKMRHAAIRIRTEEPDYSDLPDLEPDWARSVYGEVKELLPHGAPEPLGKHVTTTHYVDANLMHCLITGRSVTACLHMLNKTPVDWFSKKQATVETATYGSEFVAARTCVEQIIDLRNTLRYLGVPIRSKSYMFGDNKSVVDSSTKVHAKLHKRHTMLSFHRVREAMASGMIGFYFIPGDINPSDILSKHWGYSQIWFQLKALLFWMGDTGDIED
jgi:Reverse transcriptase (RNA-dependent DNA polymerase)